MLRRSLIFGFGLAVLVTSAGCSGASASDETPANESSGDDIRDGDVKRRTDDLFQPNESTLVGTADASLAGLATWKVYETDKGVTFRGISASNKIKVVYVAAFDKVENGAQVRSVGFVKASDFSLPEDAKAALTQIGDALKKDLAAGAGGIHTQANEDCRSKSMNALAAFGGIAAGITGAFVLASSCVATGGVTCLLAGHVLLLGGGGVWLSSVLTDTCK